jgi:hypothetical protein
MKAKAKATPAAATSVAVVKAKATPRTRAMRAMVAALVPSLSSSNRKKKHNKAMVTEIAAKTKMSTPVTPKTPAAAKVLSQPLSPAVQEKLLRDLASLRAENERQAARIVELEAALADANANAINSDNAFNKSVPTTP